MKYIISCMLYALLYLSCTRTNQQTPPVQDATSVLLDSAFFYSPGPNQILSAFTKFSYDEQGRFTGSLQYTSDSNLNGTPMPRDTFTMVLTYKGSDTLPSGYIYQDLLNYSPQDLPGQSLLTYDDQGRIILDSPNNPIYTVHYTYGNNYIFRSGHHTHGDSIIMNSKNVSRYFNGSYSGVQDYTYSKYLNPIYQLAGYAGAVFFPDWDMISHNLFSKTVTSNGGTINGTINYTWTLNADGQVIAGIGVDQDSGQPVEYYRFVYRKSA